MGGNNLIKVVKCSIGKVSAGCCSEGRATHCGTWAELRNFTWVEGWSPLLFFPFFGRILVLFAFFFFELLSEKLHRRNPLSGESGQVQSRGCGEGSQVGSGGPCTAESSPQAPAAVRNLSPEGSIGVEGNAKNSLSLQVVTAASVLCAQPQRPLISG